MNENNEILVRIANCIVGIGYEDLTHAEKQIAKILLEEKVIKKEDCCYEKNIVV